MGRRRQSERVSQVVQRFYASRDLELCTWTPLVCTELHSAHTKRVFMECQQYLRARACTNKYSILSSLLDVNSAGIKILDKIDELAEIFFYDLLL